MRGKILVGTIFALSGCAALNPFAGPPVPMTPDTPVFFQPYSSMLDQPATSTIAQVAKAANGLPDDTVTVVGSADKVGTAQVNDALSTARAQAVAAQLIADGVAASRVHAYGAGATGVPGSLAQVARRAMIRISR
jgi:hypothetical protein